MRYIYLVFIVFSFHICFSQVPTSGLIAYYNFNDNTDDQSGNRNNGTRIGGVERSADRWGNDCGALNFNGMNGYISVPSSRSLKSPSNQLTVATWFKINGGTSYSSLKWLTLVCKGEQSTETDFNPQYRMQACLPTVSINTDFTEYFAPKGIYDPGLDQWYFYALVYDGNFVVAYLNDREIFRFAYNKPFTPNDMPLDIGRDVPGSLEYFGGSMDELRIYNRALAPFEIGQLYNDKTGSVFKNEFTVSAPQNLEKDNDFGRCYASVQFPNPTVNVDCGTATLTQVSGKPSGSQFDVGKSPITFLATTTSGKKKTASFSVTVRDVEPPKITCPANITVDASTGASGAVVNFSEPTASDNCPNVKVEFVSGLVSGSQFPIGTTTIKYEAKDGFGNVTPCSFNVTVKGNTSKPVITCPANMYLQAEANKTGAVANYSEPVAMLNGNKISAARTAGPASGSLFPIGTTTVSYEAKDNAGNTVSCSFEVNVKGSADKPSITCPPDVQATAEEGKTTATVLYNEPTARVGNAALPVQLAEGPKSGAQFPIGKTKITYSAKDNNNNSVSCSFYITVTATEKAVTNCPADINTQTDAGRTYATVVYTQPTAKSGNTSLPTELTEGLRSGAQFAVGKNKVTFTAKDNTGKSVSCSFYVNVTQPDKPVINCPADISVLTDIGKDYSTVTYDKPKAKVGATALLAELVSGIASGGQFPIGVSTVTYTAKDNGNEVSCSFNVTVTKPEKLVIECPPDLSVLTDLGKTYATVNYAIPTAKIGGTPVPTEMTEGLKTGSQFPIGNTRITYKAKDSNGNMVNCTFNILVKEGVKPTIKCPADITVQAAAGSNSAVVSYTAPVATLSSTAIPARLAGGLASGERFPIGNTLVRYEAEGNGSRVECSFNVKVEPATTANITCPSKIVDVNETGKCGKTVAYKTPTLDNPDPEVKVTMTKGLSSGSFFPVGTTVVTYAASKNGNVLSECSFFVQISDVESPVIDCPPNINRTIPGDKTSILVTYSDPKATDNCQVSKVERVDGEPSGSNFSIGSHEIEYKVTDMEGNSRKCSFTINVKQEAPVVAESKTPPAVINENLHIGKDSVNYLARLQPKDCKITLFVYDDKEEDGDTISLIFNNEIIEDHRMIRIIKDSRRKNIIMHQLTLDPTKENFLIAKAWNTGQYGLNTMMMEIYDGHVENDARTLEKLRPLRKQVHSKPGLAGAITLKCQ
jgi:hypothetical protein